MPCISLACRGAELNADSAVMCIQIYMNPILAIHDLRSRCGVALSHPAVINGAVCLFSSKFFVVCVSQMSWAFRVVGDWPHECQAWSSTQLEGMITGSSGGDVTQKQAHWGI